MMQDLSHVLIKIVLHMKPVGNIFVGINLLK